MATALGFQLQGGSRAASGEAARPAHAHLAAEEQLTSEGPGALGHKEGHRHPVRGEAKCKTQRTGRAGAWAQRAGNKPQPTIHTC